MIEKIKEGIHRVCIPFEDIYTTSFILTEGKRCIIVDSGANKTDVEKYIIPAINTINTTPVFLISSHEHSDHCGGMNTLQKAFPNARQLSFSKNNIEDNQILWGRFRLLNLKGHTNDSLGILDLETEVLLSFDSLQLYGIGGYGGNITDYISYFGSINRLRNLGIRTIVASHDFVPYGYCADGEEMVEKYLDECEIAMKKIVEFVRKYNKLKDIEIAKLFNTIYPEIPHINREVVMHIKNMGV